MRDVFSSLDPAYQPFLRQLAAEPLISLPELHETIDAYLQELEAQLKTREFLDIELARSIALTCKELLVAVEARYSSEKHRVLQIAVRYFVLDDDVESDAESIIGFDDDAEVVSHAKKYLISEGI